MSEGTVGQSSNTYPRVTTTAAVTVGAATMTSSVLYAMGCMKGHQLYTPDDALVLQWCAWLFPIFHALYGKVLRLVGAEQNGSCK